MPRLRRESKRRPEVPGLEREAILAGLMGEPCPPGCNRFTHWAATCATPGDRWYPRVQAVFESLSREEKRAIRRHRRQEEAEQAAYELAEAQRREECLAALDARRAAGRE